MHPPIRNDIRYAEGERPEKPFTHPHLKLAMDLSLTCIVCSTILFLCQLVAAGCLCRPILVLGGLWNASFFLAKGVLGLRIAKQPTHGMVIADVILSLIGGTTGVMTAAYLVSGHVTVACFSDIIRNDQQTAIRRYVLEFTAIVASIPSIAGAVASFINSAIALQAAKTNKVEARPVVVYLNDFSQVQTYLQENSATTSTRPPPKYDQVAHESNA